MRSHQDVPTHDYAENVSTPLLVDNEDSQPSNDSRWFSKVKEAASKAATHVYEGGKYLVKHPVVAISSLATAAPTALNALAGPSGKSPDQIGPEWWAEMSNASRAYSVLSGAASLVVNTTMNALFLPAAIKKFKESIKNMFNSPKDFLDNFFSILIGLGGGAAAAAIAYESFLWLPFGTVAAIPFTFIALSITFASRYLGIKSIFKKFSDFFNADVTLQKDIADKLDHINARYLDDVEDGIRAILTDMQVDADSPLSEQQYEELLVRLSEELANLSDIHPSLIDETTTKEYAARYAGLIFDITFSLIVVAAPSYITFSQKGLDGVQTIAKLSTGSKIEHIEKLHEVLIGVLPGLASAMYYGDSALRFRETVVEAVSYLYQHPKSIPAAITLLAANGLASNSLTSLGNGILSKGNMYDIAEGVIGSTYKILFTIGGTVVNLNANLTKAFLLKDEPKAKDLTIHDISKRLQTSDSIMKRESANIIRQFSLWRNNDQVNPSRQNTSVPNLFESVQSIDSIVI